MPSYGRNLIIVVGGGLRPGENIGRYLWRIAKETGVGVRSLESVWKPSDGYMSKETKRKLEAAAQKKIRENDDERIAWIEKTIAHLERTDSDFYRQHIDAARAFLAHYRPYATTRIVANLSKGLGDDSEDGS